MTSNNHGLQTDNVVELGGVTTLQSASQPSISVMKTINPTVLNNVQQSTSHSSLGGSGGNVVIAAPQQYQYDLATSANTRTLHPNNNLNPMQPRQDRPSDQPTVQKLSSINYHSINSLLDNGHNNHQQHSSTPHHVPVTTAYNLTSLTTVQNHSNTVPLKPNPNLNSLNSSTSTTGGASSSNTQQQQLQSSLGGNTTTTYQLQSLPPSSYYNTINTTTPTTIANQQQSQQQQQQQQQQQTYFNTNTYSTSHQQTNEPVYQALDPAQSSFVTSYSTQGGGGGVSSSDRDTNSHHATKIIPLKSYKASESVQKVVAQQQPHQHSYYSINQPYTSSTQVQFIAHPQTTAYSDQTIDPTVAHNTHQPVTVKHHQSHVRQQQSHNPNVVQTLDSHQNSYQQHSHHSNNLSDDDKPPSSKRAKQHKFERVDAAPRPEGAEHPPVRKGRGSNKIPKNPNQYFCPHCDKNYSTKGNLEQHVRANHLNTNYECPLCPGKSFKWASGLSIHKKKVHPGEKI